MPSRPDEDISPTGRLNYNHHKNQGSGGSTLGVTVYPRCWVQSGDLRLSPARYSEPLSYKLGLPRWFTRERSSTGSRVKEESGLWLNLDG